MNPVDAAVAESALQSLIDRLGLAFHPERPIADYVTVVDGSAHDAQLLEVMEEQGHDVPASTGQPTFTPLEVEHYQYCLDLAWRVFGDGIYDEIKKIEPWKSWFAGQEA